MSDVIGGHVIHYCLSDVIGDHVIYHCLNDVIGDHVIYYCLKVIMLETVMVMMSLDHVGCSYDVLYMIK